MKPKLLDLFCGAGGATKGLQRAGFYVVGVDIKSQPRYCGDEFIQADAMEVSLDGFDAYWASPPCQAFTMMQRICKNSHSHQNLVEPVRKLLIDTGKLFVIENVVGAPLRTDLLLCGTMFGLRIIRHRIFESNFTIVAPATLCDHRDVYDPWHKDGVGQREKLLEAMAIDWFMTRPEVREAIPPAYTEFIGRQMLAAMEASRCT